MATVTATRVSRDDGYGRSSRFYDVEGRRLPSVTTILSAVGKPALIGWAARVEREMVIEAAADLYADIPVDAPRMFRAAYVSSLQARLGKTKAHTKALTKASEIGSRVHERIEWELRNDLGQAQGAPPVLEGPAEWAFASYRDWAEQVDLKPLLIEQTIWSLAHGYAGTMDWLGEITYAPGQRALVLGDWKTSKGIWPEMLLQNAAYVHALIEMGHAEPPLAGCIVRLPKVEKDPAFEVRLIPAATQAELFQVFLHVLQLWKWLDEAQ